MNAYGKKKTGPNASSMMPYASAPIKTFRVRSYCIILKEIFHSFLMLLKGLRDVKCGSCSARPEEPGARK